jgi:endonuclease/exonuclease/phosphatase family metal-dependent hydrolase
MRLVTFNALHGRSLIDGAVHNDWLAGAVASLGPDLLALQEVDQLQDRSGRVDQAAVVARAMGAAAWHFEPSVSVDLTNRVRALARSFRPARPGPAEARSDAEPSPGIGVALLSRHPVDKWHVLRLPTVPLRQRVAAATRKRGRAPLGDEPRACLAAEVRSPAGPLVAATTHLAPVTQWSPVQLRHVTEWLEGFGLPVLLLGDLNLDRPSDGWPAGWRSLVDGPTFPVAAPTVQLDHVLAWGQLPPVVGGAIHRLGVSDHLAVSVDLAT